MPIDGVVMFFRLGPTLALCACIGGPDKIPSDPEHDSADPADSGKQDTAADSGKQDTAADSGERDTASDSGKPDTGADTGASTSWLPMIQVSAGVFTMGSPKGEVGRGDDEQQREVTLTHPFAIGLTEVTQQQYESLVGEGTSVFTSCGGDCPTESVTWHEAAWFSTLASAADGFEPCYVCTGSGAEVDCEPEGDGADCLGYRLPTEAEWEYAARAGETAAYSNGGNVVWKSQTDCEGDLALDNGEVLDHVSWYCGNSDDTPHAVAQLLPNGWGLYDVHGNVWEWCQDWYGTNDKGDQTDPVGPESGTERVYRGGAWAHDPEFGRSADRSRWEPQSQLFTVGFRLVRTLE